jgi:hypothetical protein
MQGCQAGTRRERRTDAARTHTQTCGRERKRSRPHFADTNERAGLSLASAGATGHQCVDATGAIRGNGKSNGSERC